MLEVGDVDVGEERRVWRQQAEVEEVVVVREVPGRAGLPAGLQRPVPVDVLAEKVKTVRQAGGASVHEVLHAVLAGLLLQGVAVAAPVASSNFSEGGDPEGTHTSAAGDDRVARDPAVLAAGTFDNKLPDDVRPVVDSELLVAEHLPFVGSQGAPAESQTLV